MAFTDRLHNRGSISTGYDIDNSCKFEADNSEYLSRTPSSNTNRQTFTYSTWVKRTELGQNARLIDAHQDGQNFFTFGFDTSDRLVLYNIDSGVDYGGHYTRKFRDTSAWYHIVFKSDTTNGTAANRWQIYVNGVEVTGKDTDYGTPPQNYNSNLNSTISTKVGYNTDGSNGSSQYMAETHLVDGTALAPTAFGEFDEDTGIWKPIEVDVTYGTNGFYLNYENASVLGDDDSGNGNNFTETNITSADQATDTPTNNFATFNIIKRYNQGTTSFQNGGTEVTVGSGGGFWTTVFTSMAVNKGKWYFEAEVRVANGTTMWGCTPTDQTEININIDWYLGKNANGEAGAGFYDNDDAYYHNATATACTISGSSFNTQAGDIVMIGVDMDNNKLYAGVNGNWCNSSDNTLPNATGITINDELTYLAMAVYNAATHKANFGGYTTISISSAASDADGYGTFEYAPPSGYYALCTKNLAEYG